jgi:rsbT co-antagonist protein RsbR
MSERTLLTLNQVPIEWFLDQGDIHFFGLSSVLFWANPSLYRMLAPLAEEMGFDFFRLLVAQSSSFGTDEDYDVMVTQLGTTFEEGFLAWGRAVSAAGWGVFELPSFDREAGTAIVRVRNPWELRMQKGAAKSWGCPFLLGKVIGIFRHALGRPCWAEKETRYEGDVPVVEFRVHPSERTIERELERFRRERLAAREGELIRRIDEASDELRQKVSQIEEQRDLIRSLVAPIIEVWSGVLVVPLSGALSAERAERLNAELLERIVLLRARDVILDLTGIASVDAQVADHITRTIASTRLVGASCTVVGLSPHVAQAFVAIDAQLSGARTLRTLADALRDVVGLSQGRRG